MFIHRICFFRSHKINCCSYELRASFGSIAYYSFQLKTIAFRIQLSINFNYKLVTWRNTNQIFAKGFYFWVKLDWKRSFWVNSSLFRQKNSSFQWIRFVSTVWVLFNDFSSFQRFEFVLTKNSASICTK